MGDYFLDIQYLQIILGWVERPRAEEVGLADRVLVEPASQVDWSIIRINQSGREIQSSDPVRSKQDLNFKKRIHF